MNWGDLAKPKASGDDSYFIRDQAEKRWPDMVTIDGESIPFFHGSDEGVRLFWDHEARFGPSYNYEDVDPEAKPIEDIRRLLQGTATGVAIDVLIDGIWLPRSTVMHDRARGSSSGSKTPATSYSALGLVVSSNDAVGGSEGLAHECGHVRLHSLGCDLETHDRRMFLNDDEPRYVSSIRKDIRRPMSAVFQAHYSYLMVSEVDLAVTEERLGRKDAKTWASQYIVDQLGRMQFGLDEIQDNIIPAKTPEAAFIDAMLAWTVDVIDRLAEHLIQWPTPFRSDINTSYRPPLAEGVEGVA